MCSKKKILALKSCDQSFLGWVNFGKEDTIKKITYSRARIFFLDHIMKPSNSNSKFLKSNYDSFLTNTENTNKTSMDMVEPTNTGLLEVKSLPLLWQLVWHSQTLSSTITKATDCTSSSELKVWPRHLSENSSPWILEPGRYALKIHFCFNFQTPGGRTLNFPTVPEDQCGIFGIVWSKLVIFMRKGNRYYLVPFRFSSD